jgi:hypothetical protein
MKYINSEKIIDSLGGGDGTGEIGFAGGESVSVCGASGTVSIGGYWLIHGTYQYLLLALHLQTLTNLVQQRLDQIGVLLLWSKIHWLYLK